VAEASAGPHASLHLAPAPHHSVFTGQMPFLLPNQQHQSTEGATDKKARIPVGCVDTGGHPCGGHNAQTCWQTGESSVAAGESRWDVGAQQAPSLSCSRDGDRPGMTPATNDDRTCTLANYSTTSVIK